MNILGAIALIVAIGCIVLGTFAPSDIRLALPFGVTAAPTVKEALFAVLACGVLAGFWTYDLFNSTSPSVSKVAVRVACGAVLLFAVPLLLGDATPARTGLALCLGAGALASAFVAVSAMREGEVLEVTSWSGGLGGGRAGVRLSKVTGPLLIALILAGAAVACLTSTASDVAQKDKPAAGKAAGNTPTAPKALVEPKGHED